MFGAATVGRDQGGEGEGMGKGGSRPGKQWERERGEGVGRGEEAGRRRVKEGGEDPQAKQS